LPAAEQQADEILQQYNARAYLEQTLEQEAEIKLPVIAACKVQLSKRLRHTIQLRDQQLFTGNAVIMTVPTLSTLPTW